jgi:hypothetical protein
MQNKQYCIDCVQIAHFTASSQGSTGPSIHGTPRGLDGENHTMTMDARRTSPRVGPSAYNPTTMGAACSRNSGESEAIV